MTGCCPTTTMSHRASLKLSVHSWLLTVGGKRILIDTCVGNHKSAAAPAQMASDGDASTWSG